MAKKKIWRVRDAVHNIIELDYLDPLESRLIDIINTERFQRLRRIKQLGFSEYVYPGATHTRFAHSIGVFHTARKLIEVIGKFEKRHDVRFEDQHAAPALAAALLHDIGHGMFSHAFEALGKEFNWPMAHHEDVSERLIQEGEISEILNSYYSGFAGNVAEIIRDKKEIPPNLFHATVSGQFDADRLDYMQRDRLMTGVRSSYVDMEWLFANLEVGYIIADIDGEKLEPFQTLVLNAKARETAENYVFSLFHLYPTIYFHKATRGLEVLFQAVVRRLYYLVKDTKDISATGLSANHPLIQFMQYPDDLNLAMMLDDTIFWGSLPFLLQAKDSYICRCAGCFKARQLLKCVDIKEVIASKMPGDKNKAAIFTLCKNVIGRIKATVGNDSERTLFYDDSCKRPVYKAINIEDTDKRHQRIMIKEGNGHEDIGVLSTAIKGAESYEAYRAYYFRDDREAKSQLEAIISDCIKEK